MGHFSDPGAHRQPKHQNVCPDEPVVCVKFQGRQLNEPWQILKTHTHTHKWLKHGPPKGYTYYSVRKITNKPNKKKKAVAWRDMMSFHTS